MIFPCQIVQVDLIKFFLFTGTPMLIEMPWNLSKCVQVNHLG